MILTIDLGLEHTARPAMHSDSCPERDNGHPAAFIVEHKNAAGEVCSGGYAFVCPTESQMPTRGRGHFWSVLSWEPLTMTPSLQCRQCPDHGFVTNGKWVPA